MCSLRGLLREGSTDSDGKLSISESNAVEEGPGRQGLVGGILTPGQPVRSVPEHASIHHVHSRASDDFHLSLVGSGFRDVGVLRNGNAGQLDCAGDEQRNGIRAETNLSYAPIRHWQVVSLQVLRSTSLSGSRTSHLKHIALGVDAIGEVIGPDELVGRIGRHVRKSPVQRPNSVGL